VNEGHNLGFPCYCGGYLRRGEESSGTFDICPVCGWEDDIVQCNDEMFQGGASGISLQQARRNYKQFGAVSPSIATRVRPPLPDEFPK
jgi:hypothetical protein